MPSLLSRILSAPLLSLLLIAGVGCGGPPQVVNDEECFAAVDALWTAVTSKRADLVEQTMTELDRLLAEGSLSSDGYTELKSIIQLARDEQWQDSAQTLKTFMRGQRKAR